MARTVFGESRGEPYLGQLAVAWVIRNRADRPSWWGRSVRDVCLKPRQFSCWNEHDPNYGLIRAASLSDSRFRTAYRASLAAYDRSEPDPTKGATSYHTLAKPAGVSVWPPGWAGTTVPRGQIGAHMFYAED